MAATGVTITDLMTRYCDAVVPLWNVALLPLLSVDFVRPEMETENEWDLRDRYCGSCVDIFRGMVLWPLGLHVGTRLPSYRADQAPIPEIVASPRGAVKVHVVAQGLHPFQGYDYSITSTDQADLDLRFQDFFDFDELTNRTYEWVRTVVAHSDRRPELAGRAALIARADVDFLYVAP